MPRGRRSGVDPGGALPMRWFWQQAVLRRHAPREWVPGTVGLAVRRSSRRINGSTDRDTVHVLLHQESATDTLQLFGGFVLGWNSTEEPTDSRGCGEALVRHTRATSRHHLSLIRGSKRRGTGESCLGAAFLRTGHMRPAHASPRTSSLLERLAQIDERPLVRTDKAGSQPIQVHASVMAALSASAKAQWICGQKTAPPRDLPSSF